MVRAFLEADGFDVVEATDGSRALAIARGGGIDLVRCDVAMPAMDGLELIATSPGPGRGATFTLALVDTTGPLEDFDAGTKGSV